MARGLQALLQRLLAPALRELGVALERIQADLLALQEAEDEKLERIAQEVQKLQQQHSCVLGELQALKGQLEEARRAAEAEPEWRFDPDASPAWKRLEGRMAALEAELSRLRGVVDELTAAKRGTSVEVSEQERSEPEGDASAEEIAEAPSPDEPAAVEELPQLRIPSIAPRTRTRTRRPPEQRGGRPRVGLEAEARVRAGIPESPRRPSPSRAVQAAKGPRQRLELLCVKRGREWKLLLKPPEGGPDGPELEAIQGDSSLPWDEALGAWLLPRLDEAVDVEGPSGRRSVFEGLPADEGLLFKLNADLDEGRRVRKASRGWYLAIVPEGWERTEDSPPTSEPVAIPGYAAHYFDLSEDPHPQVTFLVGGQERVPWQRIELHLVGEQLPDAAERLGPLFRGPPALRAERSVWETIATIVVGEEGRGEGRWKTSFKPDPTREVQGLPPELAARGGGWYFLRFYDHADELIDSLDFRFLSALEGIRIEPGGPVIVPGPEGHRPARVEFRHQGGCRVELCDRGSASLRVVRESRRTVIILPPEPGWDETRWRVQLTSQGSSSHPVAVDLKIRIPRLWWALAEKDEPPPETDPRWRARPLSLTRGEFGATSKKALWLKLPPGVRQIRFGFPGDLRSFKAKAHSPCVVIELGREFYEVAEMLSRRPGKTPLLLQLESLKGKYKVGQLEVRLGCRWCKTSTFDANDLLNHLLHKHRAELYREVDEKKLPNELLPTREKRDKITLPKVGDTVCLKGRKGVVKDKREVSWIHGKTICYIVRWEDGTTSWTPVDHFEEEEVQRQRKTFSFLRLFKESRQRLLTPRLVKSLCCQLCGQRFDYYEVGELELRRHIRDQHLNQVSYLI